MTQPPCPDNNIFGQAAAHETHRQCSRNWKLALHLRIQANNSRFPSLIPILAATCDQLTLIGSLFSFCAIESAPTQANHLSLAALFLQIDHSPDFREQNCELVLAQ
ncbi:unnamed protein product, partial [Mesorhabditis belari]|uniref:Uncharacterized protein n=1 Tax=Mesorhabditis belari TaxID=2138241 RepID=A0AAF3EUQ4_9BILA